MERVKKSKTIVDIISGSSPRRRRRRLLTVLKSAAEQLLVMHPQIPHGPEEFISISRQHIYCLQLSAISTTNGILKSSINPFVFIGMTIISVTRSCFLECAACKWNIVDKGFQLKAGAKSCDFRNNGPIDLR